MFTRTLSLAAFVASLLMLAGCSSAPKLEKIGVRIKEIAPSPAVTTITLLFVNPNNVPLVVQETAHTFTLDGTSMWTVKNPKPLGIPPLGSVAESVALSGPVAKAVAHFTASHSGRASYVIDSTLQISWGEDIHAYKTSDRGSVALPSAVGAP
jgi:LEA14-like dessication related protein